MPEAINADLLEELASVRRLITELDEQFPERNGFGELLTEGRARLERIHARLLDDDNQFRQLAENIRDAFWVTSPDYSEMIYISPAYEEIWGRTCESLYKNPLAWLESIHPDDRNRVHEALLRDSPLGKFDEEYRIVRPDGSFRWIHDRSFPVRDAEGGICRNAGVAVDITKRKQTEEQMREGHQLLNAVIEGTTDLIYVKNLNGQYLMVNSACARIFGRPVEEIIGKDCTQLYPPELARQVTEGDRSIIDSEKAQTFEETITPVGTDSPRTYLSMKALLKDDQGNVVGLVGIARDVTERNRVEEQVRHLTEDIQHASRLSVMGEMVAGVAHELHQPLAVIANYAHGCRRRLEKGRLEEKKMVETMEHISSAALQAGQIVNRIKDFISKNRFEKSLLDVNEAIQDALELSKLAVDKEGVIVKGNLSKNLPHVVADRTQIIQVVLNLILNGIEAMTGIERGRRKITIRTLVDSDQCVRVEVADVGRGIPLEQEKKIFEQFVTTKPHGLGIGLSISRTIVEEHGGRIWFDSVHPSGSLFQFTLPPITQE